MHTPSFKLILFTLFGAILVACTTTLAPTPTPTPTRKSDTSGVTVIVSATIIPPTPKPIDLADLGLAPDFTNDTWLNTDEPLTLEKLKGKVVLVEFWTYS